MLLIMMGSFRTYAQTNISDYLKKNIENADLIVMGEVTGHHSFWDLPGRNIYTSYQIKVLTLLKGEMTENPELIIKGGIVENIWQQVSTSIKLNAGDRGYFILTHLGSDHTVLKDVENKFHLIGGIRGFFKLSHQESPNLENGLTSDSSIRDLIIKQTSRFTRIKTMDAPELKNGSMIHSISSISPKTLTAGTGAVLDIYGKGFGSKQGDGQVWFVYSDNSSNIFSNTGFHIITWSDTHIQIVVPDNAATGNVRIKIGEEFAISSEILTVRYAHMNNHSLPTILINTNEQGGYTWHFHTDLQSNIAAKNILEQSIKKWVCLTMIPWEIGAMTSATSGRDHLCSIYFGKLEDEGGESLGQANGFYEGVVTNSSVTEWVLKEVDIVFADHVNWGFDRTELNSAQMDFESVVLHELAHAHLIGHVNDENDLMHYGIELGNFRDVNASNVECGNYIVNKSLNFSNAEHKPIGVTVNSLPATPTISQQGERLHSSAVLGNQWYNKKGLIAGATDQDYRPKANEDCYVIVSSNGCSSTPSNAIHFIPTAIIQSPSTSTIKVYPNPVATELIILNEGYNKQINYEICDSKGRTVFRGAMQDKAVLKTGHITPGIYILKLQSGETVEFRKILKE